MSPAGVAVSALNPDAVARQPLPAVVDSVEPGSIGEDADNKQLGPR